MELAIILSSGILTGILIGLFPVFPIYLGAFLLYITATIWTPEQMLLFWAISSIGSQFFCSVSTITLGIPGDASSLIYVNDVKKLSLSERNRLLWQTSRGSLVSAFTALCLVWLLYNSYSQLGLKFLGKVEIKFILLYTVILFLIFTSKNKIITTLIAAFAILIAPQNNYALPIGWYTTSIFLQHTTFFMLVLAMVVIPDVVSYDTKFISNNKEKFNPEKTKLPWWLVIKNTIIGCTVSLVPGPAAEISAATAYYTTKSNTNDKIIAAETANNPGVIMMLLPFFLLGLPFTPSSIIVSNIMDIKVVNVIELAKSSSSVISGISVLDSIILLALMTVVFYYILSIRFINFYTNIVKLAHSRLKIILLIIVIAMIYLDVSIQEISWISYLLLLFGYMVIGFIMKKFHINPMPFIFVYLLGDIIIWTTMQVFLIHF
jgi:putative tricarboxylic transport membrane protein